MQKAREMQKRQAGKKRGPQREFKVWDKICLSTKFLNLRLPCMKLGSKYIGPSLPAYPDHKPGYCRAAAVKKPQTSAASVSLQSVEDVP